MNKPYLYQTLHIGDGQIRRVEEHTTVLNEASQTLFERPFSIDLTTEVEKLNLGNGTHFVRVEVSPEGEVQLIHLGKSLYEGFALRAVRPSAMVFEYDIPYPDLPTSARWAAHELTTAMAQKAGCHIAIRVGTDGLVYTADDAELVGIRGDKAYTRFRRDQLPLFDELYYIDHRGVTAIGKIEDNVYADIIAAKIAKTL